MKILFRLAALCSLPFCFGCSVTDIVAAQGSAEGSFERTLVVSGLLDLDVSTGAGQVTVRRGQPGRVDVQAEVRVSERGRNRESAEELVAAIQQNPPIERVGDTIRIGDLSDYGNPKNVAISYEITVPTETVLRSRVGSGRQDIDGISGPVDVSSGSGSLTISRIQKEVQARTGSGAIRLRDVGDPVSVRTGSGGIIAEGVAGRFDAKTGSGGIRMTQTAPGDVDVLTGSGSIELSRIEGALTVRTGSGGIMVDGELIDRWNLDTKSGGIVVRLSEDARFDLTARTASGSITVDHPVIFQGRLNRNAVQGTVRGGGSSLDVRTASGSIRIE